MKKYIFLVALLLAGLYGCKTSDKKIENVELIEQDAKQAEIFRSLMQVTMNKIPGDLQSDSLAFLILPIKASCPSCRKKTIDSIVKHQASLAAEHFIIISCNGGRKTISSFFREQNFELPVIDNRLFLDSTNEAYKKNLYDTKPFIYYTHDKRAYKRIGVIPATVRADLANFFSGKPYDSKIVMK